RYDTFLNPRATRVVDPDDRTAVLHGEIHHLADLLREHLAQRAPEHGEVLREDEDLATEHRPVAGHNRIAVGAAVHHPEVRLAMANVAVELHEGLRIAQQLCALSREQAAFLTS